MHNARMSHAQRAQTPDNSCIVQAYAKINLTLDVLGRRDDGYHALATVMQTIDLHDTIYLSAVDDDDVQIACTLPALNNSENLAVRAAQLLRQRLGLTQGVMIEVHKRIPVAGGLGGGSSDAAAVLLALKRWWQLPLLPSDLLDLAASLGSDVPFFLTGGLALCEALHAGKMPEAEDLHNSLERSVLEAYPEVAQARDDLLEAGASLVRLSGSGPTLFAPFAEHADATRVQGQLQGKG